MRKILFLTTLLLTGLFNFSQDLPDASQFKNIKTFIVSGSFQLPAGTTRIMVELWGAGGGGCTIGGGGGGAYGKALINVSSGSNVLITIGAGGLGGDTRGNNGGLTGVGYRPPSSPVSVYTFNARGGEGSQFNSGIASHGAGGNSAYSTGGSEIGFYSVAGEDACMFEDNYQQAGTTYITRHVGNGGNAGNTLYTAGRGDVVLNPTTPTYKRTGTTGKNPGGGGGGGIPRGYQGGNGMVVLHY